MSVDRKEMDRKGTVTTGNGRAADGSDDGGPGAPEVGGGRVPRAARRVAVVLLAALMVPGIIGFELWPLTGWRLFSMSRGTTRATWVLQAVEADGSTRLLDLEELPMAYSNAEWPLRSVGGGSFERREELCTALLDAAVEVDPAIVSLQIARDRQELVQDEDGSWTVSHDLDIRHSCGATIP